MAISPKQHRNWFHQTLKANKQSMSALARRMDLDKSAVSRMLSGARGMKAEEQDKIADFLGVSVSEVAAHRPVKSDLEAGAATTGFSEMAQETYTPANKAAAVPPLQLASQETTIDIEDLEGKKHVARHPAFGSLKGTTIVMPGVDLTEPADPEWVKIYAQDYDHGVVVRPRGKKSK